MKLVEVRHETELLALRDAWQFVLGESASNTIFLTWEWVKCWWEAYGKSGELRILTAYDDNGILRGIAPLRKGLARRFGQPVSTLSFLGDGSNDSDYLDFIAASGWEEPVWRVFKACLEEELLSGTILLLSEIPESSPHLRLLKEFVSSPGRVSSHKETACGTVRLPTTWEEYLSTLRPRFRTKVRSVLRNFEKRPEVRFGFCETPEKVERMLPILFDLHTRRWTQEKKPGVFGWDKKRAFYQTLSPTLLEREWLRFTWLEWNGTILACQYGFTYQHTYSQLQEGYEPASETWNPGIGLRAWSIRHFIQQGLSEYDFLGGLGRHKTDWGAESKKSQSIVVGRDSFRSRVFCHGPNWEARLRSSAAAVLPERILAYRRARQQQEGSGNMMRAGSNYVQKMLARCYFYSGLPAAARPVRERYQLSISPNSGRILSFNRRTNPSGRILSYHRVNNDQDPFFPAMPVSLFERQMHYVARHYKVVSLGALLEHLKSNSTETLFAVTFDDGYQDNYENALPILVRYGLPATIFLTTGNLDSREPTWFEQLAGAIKTTDREFIDLETDVPRRFWMRTPTERLRSNHEIFSLLRNLEDGERRCLLSKVLECLATSTDIERRDKMLTWDQVRLMSGQRIDFGGHTVTHPIMSKLPPEQAKWEVSECKRRIEEELRRPIAHFAYPNGRREDFTAHNKDLIRTAGYQAAVSTIWGMNTPSTDRFELRRGGPWEEDVAMFAYKLDWYQLVNG